MRIGSETLVVLGELRIPARTAMVPLQTGMVRARAAPRYMRRYWTPLVFGALALSFVAGCAHTRERQAGAADASGITVAEAAGVPESGTGAITVSEIPPLGENDEELALREFDVREANVPNPLRFRVDDSVRMLVWNHTELTHVAPVQMNGNVTLPLVGEVPAEGRTPKEIREEVEARLRALALTETVYVQPGDSLRMVVWRQNDLTHIGKVQPDGMITFPLVDQVPAANRTLDEIRAEVEKRLARHLEYPQVSIMPEELHSRGLVNPNISILPESLVERRVAVLGEVFIPGLYPIRGRMRVLDALAQAGYRETAHMNDVIVIRDREGEQPVYQFLRLKDYLEGNAPDQNIFLQDGDVVMAPKTRIAKVGAFIDQFFNKTRPVLDWWIALTNSWISLQNARYAEDIARTTTQVNQIILEQLGAATIGF